MSTTSPEFPVLPEEPEDEQLMFVAGYITSQANRYFPADYLV